MTKIAIIIGSTRPNRFAPKVAAWLADLASQETTATFATIDLAEVNLPLLDEPQPPMMGQYANDHTKAWAQTVAAYDGFVFITPEYNHGYPAALKNALDFLYAEWNYKPAAFVSYGAGAGGARSVEQLREVIVNLNMFSLADHVSFVNYWTQLDENSQLTPSEQQEIHAEKLLSNMAFWSAQFQRARTELAQHEA